MTRGEAIGRGGAAGVGGMESRWKGEGKGVSLQRRRRQLEVWICR